MPEPRIHVIARDIQRHDAVGNFCRQIRGFLKSHEFEVILAAENCHPEDRAAIPHLDEVIPTIGPDDVTLFHFSTEDPLLPALAHRPNPKILYFHNLTPERFFLGTDDHTAYLVRQGLLQLPLAGAFDVLMANSAASARTLHAGLSLLDQQRISEATIVACPPVIGVDRWAAVAEATTETDVDSRTIVQVGRIAPHKGSTELLEGFAVLAGHDPTVRLLFVGAGHSPSELSGLTAKANELPQQIRERVQFLEDVSDEELKSIYRQAGVCAAMSFHEGFGVPLLDALVFDKPLVIRNEAAMTETAADAAIIIRDPTPRAIADALASALDNEKRRAELASARPVRVDELRRLADGHLLLEAISRARSLHRS